MKALHPLLCGLLALAPAALSRTWDSWKVYDRGSVARVDVSVDPAALAWMYENVESDSLHLAQLHFQNAWLDEEVADVGLRLRGNTSRFSAKKSFKISFNDFVPGREFHDVDKLNLNGEHNDPSIARSALCFNFFRRIGLAASRDSHAELWINGDYFGLYANVEHVDDEFLWKHFENPGGNLWKCLWPADLAWRGPDPEDYQHQQDGRPVYELTTNEEGNDYTALVRLVRILHDTPDAALEDSLGDYLDVAGVLQYFAANVLLGSWDDYWYLQNNYYLYHDPVADRMALIPYDYDNTFGVDWFGVDWATRNPYSWGASGRPLAQRILARPRWRNLYTHFLELHNTRSLDPAVWAARLDSLHTQLRPHAEPDSFRTLDYGFTMTDFDESYGDSYQNQHVGRGILEYVQLRHQSLPAQLTWQNAGPVAYDLKWSPRHPGPGDSLRVDAAAFSHAAWLAVTLRWRSQGTEEWNTAPMTDTGDGDSEAAREADRWSAWLPPQAPGAVLELQVEAVDGQNRTHRHPPVRPLSVSWREDAPLSLNEFLALNTDDIVDPHGENEDWVELFNRGSEPAELAGLCLSDDFGDPCKWAFPDFLPPLPPGDFLLVWCDNDLEQQGLHAAFRLSGDGEELVLSAADGVTILDSLTFGPQMDDVSLGRLPDGTGAWQAFADPTPGESNGDTSLEPGPGPTAFTLAARPNPFNGGVKLRLESLHGMALVEIFDVAGRLIHRQSLHVAGRQEVALAPGLWASLPSGFCVARVTAYGQSRCLRLLHLK